MLQSCVSRRKFLGTVVLIQLYLTYTTIHKRLTSFWFYSIISDSTYQIQYSAIYRNGEILVRQML